MSENCQPQSGHAAYAHSMKTLTPPQTRGAYLRRLSSPIGRIEITGDGEFLTGLAIENAGELPHDEQIERSCAVLDSAADQLGEYFAGKRRSFDLPLSAEGTAFQKSVWLQLNQLPFGTAVSYADIGRATGRPSAGRAVGGAVGANPIPIIVPCHRVLASNRKITGYSGGDGIPTKVWLLAHEGISHQ